MKTIPNLVLTAVLCVAASSRAEEINPNHISLSGRFGFNVSGKFKGIGGGLLGPGGGSTRQTPDGDTYNYDDGYLLTDVSGNYGGQTWYVGYDDSSSQISGNTLLLSRSTASGSLNGSSEDAGPTLGFELVYSRELGRGEKRSWGLEAAVNWQPIDFKDNGRRYATVSRVTDAYAFESGTTPPSASPGSPYQGSYGGPGFLFNDTPISSSTTLVPGGAYVDGKHEFDGNLWGFRVGPYLEFDLGSRSHLAVSGGLAVGFLGADVDWSETAYLPGGGTASGSGRASDSEVLWGAYLQAQFSYDLGNDWRALAGAQYQYLGTYEHTFAGRGVELDMTGTFFFTIGFSKSF